MKKIFTLSMLACASGMIFAQSIATVSVEGSLAPASRRTTNPGLIEAVVAPDFNMSNVIINYTLDDGCELLGPMPTDFSTVNPQTVTVKKTDDETTKDWTINIKKINPSGLPFSKTFSNSEGNKTADWTPATIGWAFSGIDTGQTGTCRYGTADASFVVAFNVSPGTVTYRLNSVSSPFKAGDEFNVESSADGVIWRNLRSFTTEGALTTAGADFTDNLIVSDRYVRWVYVKRTGINVNLNNIVVNESAGTGASLEITSTGYGLKKFSVKHGMQLYTKTSNSARDALELHAVVMSDFDYNDPANNVFEIADGFTLTSPASIPTNFSTPQEIILNGGSPATDNTWTVYVRNIKPAGLPIDLVFDNTNPAEWNNTTVGWAPCGINSARPATMAFDGNKTSVIFGFTDIPEKITYDLCINAKAPVAIPDDAVFEIQTADENANSWTTIHTYSKDNQIPASDAASITNELNLNSNVRYVKFLYTNRGSSGGKNLNLNNIKITKTGSGIDNIILNNTVLYQPAAGEIIFTQPVVKAELYNMFGELNAVHNNPGSTLSVTDGSKGIVIIRVTLEDGTIVSQKVMK